MTFRSATIDARHFRQLQVDLSFLFRIDSRAEVVPSTDDGASITMYIDGQQQDTTTLSGVVFPGQQTEQTSVPADAQELVIEVTISSNSPGRLVMLDHITVSGSLRGKSVRCGQGVHPVFVASAYFSQTSNLYVLSNVLTEVIGLSLDECAQSCLDNVNCKSFDYANPEYTHNKTGFEGACRTHDVTEEEVSQEGTDLPDRDVFDYYQVQGSLHRLSGC